MLQGTSAEQATVHPFRRLLTAAAASTAAGAPQPVAQQHEATREAMRQALAEAPDVDEDEAEDFLLLKVRTARTALPSLLVLLIVAM